MLIIRASNADDSSGSDAAVAAGNIPCQCKTGCSDRHCRCKRGKVSCTDACHSFVEKGSICSNRRPTRRVTGGNLITIDESTRTRIGKILQPQTPPRVKRGAMGTPPRAKGDATGAAETGAGADAMEVDYTEIGRAHV